MELLPYSDADLALTEAIWEADWRGAKIHEMGWMVLPEFQGRGIASAAMEMILSRARSERRFRSVHAFPSVSNLASNALCRKFGFSKLEECDGGYAGRAFRCNHWELEL